MVIFLIGGSCAGLLSVLVICARSGLFDVFINDLEREGSHELIVVGDTELFKVLK